ncbi:MAG: FGGY family carbohydrate kinase, partial [Dehalococcoidales bacterium]|nr:FGGY family carbohydrate kinase [Dehalococcoidales bacterium]
MSEEPYILAIDQGTTGTSALLFDITGREVSRAYRETAQSYPRPGWVEHDPAGILRSSVEAAGEAVMKTGVPYTAVKGLGITNQ